MITFTVYNEKSIPFYHVEVDGVYVGALLAPAGTYNFYVDQLDGMVLTYRELFDIANTVLELNKGLSNGKLEETVGTESS